MIFLLTVPAFAASETWDGSENTGTWATVANWAEAGVVPGIGDTATFNNAGGTVDLIDLGAGVSVNTITFATNAAAAYTIGSAGQTLTLWGAWNLIDVQLGVVATETIAANVVLLDNYFFRNNGANDGFLLNFTGTVTGPGGAGTHLYLTGTDTGNNTISGAIVNGVATLAVDKEGVGTWVLSGANTYTGVTTLTAGTLSVNTINNGGVAGSIGAATNAAANLVFNGGTLQYTGVTASTNRNFTINAGTTATIQVDGGTGVVLTISGASTATTGALTKTGTGTLTLSGANLYTGATAINAGTVVASNANALGNGSAVTVANGATLDVGTTNVTVNAVYTQQAGSTLKVTIASPSSSGKITSNANAVVSATSNVNVTVPDNIYIPTNTTFTIIDGAGGAGVNVPGTIASSNPRLTFSSLSLNGDLILTANRSGTGFSSLATNSNASAVGAVLDNISTPSSDMTTVLNTLEGLSNSQTASALDTVVPIVDSGITTTSNNSLNQFIGTTTQRMEELYAQAHDAETGDTGVSTGSEGLKGIDVWGQGFGEYAHQDHRGLSNGYHATIWGTAIGGDIPAFNDRVRLGLSGGYAQSDINSKDNSGNTDIDSYQGTLYGGYIDGEKPYYINGAFSFAYNKYNSLRHIAVGTITRTADADYDGQQYSVLFDGGYTFKAGDFRMTPIASLQYIRLHLEGYTESGADALNLSVKSQNYDMLQSGLGMKFERPFELKESMLIPEVHAKWLYDFIGDKQETTSTFSGGGGSFATQGFNPARNSLDVGAKLTLATKWNWSLETNYDFEYKEDFTAHTGWADIRYGF